MQICMFVVVYIFYHRACFDHFAARFAVVLLESGYYYVYSNNTVYFYQKIIFLIYIRLTCVLSVYCIVQFLSVLTLLLTYYMAQLSLDGLMPTYLTILSRKLSLSHTAHTSSCGLYIFLINVFFFQLCVDIFLLHIYIKCQPIR